MKFHAVVLAAQRPGVVNELAKAAGVSHKCIMELAGKKLIEHVVDCLVTTPCIGSITVSIDQPDVLDACPEIQALIVEERLRIVMSQDNLFTSVQGALVGDNTFPSIITTADNVLLTPDMVTHFCDEIIASSADASVAIIEKDTLLAKYPNGQRRFHKFADNEYSNCNLYAIVSKKTINIGKLFETGGQFAKYPSRVLKAFGIINAFAYRFALFSFDTAMKRLSKRFDAKLVAIRMPFPEAPIDVDNERTKKIAENILLAAQNT